MGSSVPNGFGGLDAPRCKENSRPVLRDHIGYSWLASLRGHCLILNNESLLIIILIIGPHVGAWQARGVLKGSKFGKGERNVKVEVSLRGVCLYAKYFHLRVRTQCWMEEREGGWGKSRSILTSATVDYKITTLGMPF